MPAVPPTFITAFDKELVGSTSARDPLGILPIWSLRGRDIVPHLTEQTTSAEGFQLLLTSLWLWSKFLQNQRYTKHNREIRAFYLVVEQAFARAYATRTQDWPLPGRNRVMARRDEHVHQLSIHNHEHHLLRSQLANGTWGLYRGAAVRSGMLSKDGMSLTREAWAHVAAYTGLTAPLQVRLFDLAHSALERPDHGVQFSADVSNTLATSLADILQQMPQGPFIEEHLLSAHPSCSDLATRLLSTIGEGNPIPHREFITEAAEDHEEHRPALENILACENLLAPIESVFRWLCHHNGHKVHEAIRELPVEMSEFEGALIGFRDSGTYTEGAKRRHALYSAELQISDREALVRSIVHIHKKVSDERRKAPWVYLDENDRLVSGIEASKPDRSEMIPGVSWRNDYYLGPLLSVARRLSSEAA